MTGDLGLVLLLGSPASPLPFTRPLKMNPKTINPKTVTEKREVSVDYESVIPNSGTIPLSRYEISPTTSHHPLVVRRTLITPVT